MRIAANPPCAFASIFGVEREQIDLTVEARRVLIRGNEKDLVDVPEEAKDKIKFVPVENVDEVLEVALEKNGTAAASSQTNAKL
jgi:HSP20 family molecular chaperone IbpA